MSFQQVQTGALTDLAIDPAFVRTTNYFYGIPPGGYVQH